LKLVKETSTTVRDLYERGLKLRREVLGANYVDASISAADEFMSGFQRITTEWCWGYAWSRDGLDRKTRSMVNPGMLTALGKPSEIKLHVKGALSNGVSVEEIKELLIHATVYCGIPASLEAFKAAHQVLVDEGALPWKS
jgi:4-carboxymuconolactone decarboxylase